MADQHLIALSTCPSPELAERIAEALVQRGCAACVNMVPGMTSVYRWKGEVCRDAETLLIMKTTATAYPALESTVMELHTEELPELITVPITGGLPGYLAWVSEQTASAARRDR